MKRITLSAICLLMAAGPMTAATFFSRSTQGQVNTWASIWTNASQTTAVAPTAGNTYELVFNGTFFGSSATGGSLNNTRFRNPYGAGAVGGVQTFPGDSLTVNADTEIRFKALTGLTAIDFPGVGGNPGLILNGGVLNAGDNIVFNITGKIHVTAASLICPADNGAGAVMPLRGFNISGALSGTGNLIVCQAGVTVAQEVTSSLNSFNGEWIVKAGWLKGTGYESLGQGNITIDPLALVPMTTLSVLSNGPAQLELMYDINSSGHLTLRNGGKMILHQHCRFAAVTIDLTDLAPGAHSYAELAAAFPANFAPGGVGSITVGAPRRVVTVNTVNNEPPSLNDTSLLQALTGLQDGDIIRFNIPGAGPHVIVTPLGGYPLLMANDVTIDGYTQPGSAPNTNPILGGNNAQIKIVLDSTGADSGPTDPQDPNLNSRRSTRILHSGYGDSENGILAVFGGDNFTVRGLSFIARRSAGSTDDPAIYAVALVNQATNARVQGCWFGLAPGGSTMADVKPVSSAVAGFRYRTGGDVYSFGCIVGTDGDGVTDRAEFNVMVGGRIAMALELPGARISGNYVNFFPDGLHFVDLDDNYQQWRDVFEAGGSDPDDVTIENYENGRVTAGSVIGTNGDGVSDSDERNVFGHVIYDHHGEFYSSSVNAVLAGNYFGVGVDGITPSPLSTNVAPDFVEFGGGSGQVRIGSNGDGISDDLEGNLIVNVPGGRFVKSGSGVPIVSRRNKMVNCNVSAVPFADGENAAYAAYYAAYLADASTGVAPVLRRLTNGILNGTIPAAGAAYPNVEFDLYKVDPVALAQTNFWPLPKTHPMTWLGTYTDNGPGDLNPNANEFSINVSSFGLSDTTYLAAAASYSAIPGLFNATNAVTSPMSNPISARPTLSISLEVLGNATLSWLAPEGLFRLEFGNDLNDPGSWFPLGTGTYTGGRNVILNGHDPFSPGVFFRLVAP